MSPIPLTLFCEDYRIIHDTIPLNSLESNRAVKRKKKKDFKGYDKCNVNKFRSTRKLVGWRYHLCSSYSKQNTL